MRVSSKFRDSETLVMKTHRSKKARPRKHGTIGYVRATTKIVIANLTYNLMRCVLLKKKVYAAILR